MTSLIDKGLHKWKLEKIKFSGSTDELAAIKRIPI